MDVGNRKDYSEALTEFKAGLSDDLEVLTDLLGHSAYDPAPQSLIDKARTNLGPSGPHWEFVERMVAGVASNSKAIDDLIERFSLNWKVSRMGRVDRNILRLAAYELAFEPDVPSRATLNEAIEIAKRFGTEDSGKFVNGLLDRIAQEFGRI